MADSDFLVILNMEKDYKIPVKTKAASSIAGLLKVSRWGCDEGYFAIGMDVIKLHPELQIINLE